MSLWDWLILKSNDVINSLKNNEQQSLHSVQNESDCSDELDWLNRSDWLLMLVENKIHVKKTKLVSNEITFWWKCWMTFIKKLFVSNQLIK